MPFTYVIFAPGHNPNLFTWFFLAPALLVSLPLLVRAITTRRDRPDVHSPMPLAPQAAALAAHE